MASPRWPNVEREVVAWLTARTGHYVATETDDTIADHLPAHKVTRAGGGTPPDATGLTRTIQVEVETMTAKTAPRADLWEATADVATAMYDLAANGTTAWFVDEVTETFPAAVLEDSTGGVRRASATFGLAVRPTPTT